MKIFQLKQSRWIYAILVILILVFLGFSILPSLTTALNANQSPSSSTLNTSALNLSTERQLELKRQADGYELVIEREPDNETALRGLLEVRLEQRNLPGAVEALEGLAKLHPEQTDYLVLLAQGKKELGDFEGSAQAYRQILNRKPGNINALQGLSALLLQQNRPEAAIDQVQQTLKMAAQLNTEEPDSVDVTSVQLLLAQIYALEERYPEAIAVYDQIIESNQDDFRPLLGKAMIMEQQDKVVQAKPLFTQALNLAPAKYKDQIQQLMGELETEVQPEE